MTGQKTRHCHLKGLAEKDEHVTYLFSKFWQKSGNVCRIYECEGDYVAVMDADMQDPPALLPQMFAMLTSGEFDSVATRRVNREGEPPIRAVRQTGFTALSTGFPMRIS